MMPVSQNSRTSQRKVKTAEPVRKRLVKKMSPEWQIHGTTDDDDREANSSFHQPRALDHLCVRVTGDQAGTLKDPRISRPASDNQALCSPLADCGGWNTSTVPSHVPDVPVKQASDWHVSQLYASRLAPAGFDETQGSVFPVSRKHARSAFQGEILDVDNQPDCGRSVKRLFTGASKPPTALRSVSSAQEVRPGQKHGRVRYIQDSTSDISNHYNRVSLEDKASNYPRLSASRPKTITRQVAWDMDDVDVRAWEGLRTRNEDRTWLNDSPNSVAQESRCGRPMRRRWDLEDVDNMAWEGLRTPAKDMARSMCSGERNLNGVVHKMPTKRLAMSDDKSDGQPFTEMLDSPEEDAMSKDEPITHGRIRKHPLKRSWARENYLETEFPTKRLCK
ncbi:hypothetical protein F4779DRAFT_128409 [Xylariaceae sp. FL0662B]|nr:hypothetical protein F4779DRAFT_128409 [Xylariaceae sp. FL0662B]